VSFSINTNVTSLQAQEYLRVTSDFQGKTINRVTSGLRIVSSGDDAAGLAIANGFRSDQAVLSQGVRNANDGLSTLQTIDGGMSNISKLLDRARTLATQSASGTFTGDRNVLNSEFQSVISEIDRQAQAIGLNQGGAFAKSLAVFIGGGKGTTDASVISNGSVGVDLSKSTVDAKSLGMNTYRAVNQTAYDLSSTSATSVSKIVANATGTTATFWVRGAGFSDKAGAPNAIKLDVNLQGVKDTDTLVAAINDAISRAANPTTETDQSKAFKAANLSASIVTDQAGRKMLSFDSANSAFQIRGGDSVANALLGNFSAVGATTGAYSSTAVAGTFADLTADESAATISINGGTGVALGAAFDHSSALTVDDAVAGLNAGALSGNDVQAYNNGGKLAFYSKTGKSFTVAFDFSANQMGYTDGTTYSSTESGEMVSGGAAMSAQTKSTTGTDHSTEAYSFTALGSGESQTLTLSAVRSDGHQVSFDVTLDATTGDTLENAIDAINTQIQAANDSSLQSIFAVREGNGIRFISNTDFSVKLGNQASDHGVYETYNGGAQTDNAIVSSMSSGASGAVDISNQTSAQNAVSQLAKAVITLGNAQAVVGRGQNQFNYAVNLAQSQLSNLAAAESRIRDADLAAEAANLTKAQILLQAGVAALAQANSAPQQVLSLLRG
jgi:flagellin